MLCAGTERVTQQRANWMRPIINCNPWLSIATSCCYSVPTQRLLEICVDSATTRCLLSLAEEKKTHRKPFVAGGTGCETCNGLCIPDGFGSMCTHDAGCHCMDNSTALELDKCLIFPTRECMK